MTAIATEDAWMETCFISIMTRDASDNVQFAALTKSIEIDPGEKGIEGQPVLNGGRIRMWKPQSDTTITFEAVPLFAGTTSGTTGKGYFDLMHTTDTTFPIAINATRNRPLHRIAILWTNDTSVTSAHTATTDTFSAIRYVFANCVITSVKSKFDPEEGLMFTITAKCTPFNKAGTTNMKFESCEGSTSTDILPALASYTSSATW